MFFLTENSKSVVTYQVWPANPQPLRNLEAVRLSGTDFLPVAALKAGLLSVMSELKSMICVFSPEFQYYRDRPPRAAVLLYRSKSVERNLMAVGPEKDKRS